MTAVTTYTTEKADIIVHAIASGVAIMNATKMAGICHMTAYNWRKQYPEFAARWAEAVEIATDCIESVVASHAMNGNLPAAFYWLRHRRPNVYNREMMAKLAMLNAALAQQSTKGNGKVTVTIDEHGIPHIVENQRRPVVILPSNNRETLPDYLLPDHQSPDPRTDAIEQVAIERAVARQEQLDLAIDQPIQETEPVAEVIPLRQPPIFAVHPDHERWKALSE
jgi:hypothetical protein